MSEKTPANGAGLADVANSMAGLNISDHISETQSVLAEKIDNLIQAANTAVLQAQQAKTLVEGTNTISSDDITEICGLRSKANGLEEAANALGGATERSIIEHVISLGDRRETIINSLISHFDKRIMTISRDILDNSDNDPCVLWRIAEKCYMEAIRTSGKLHSDDYFIPLEETYLESPFDPDFESEEYYEHENRLEIDEGYARAYRYNRELKEQRKRRERERWIDFWVRVLSNCPSGPTLFYPPAAATSLKWPFQGIPRYLFRVFDSESSGRNDDTVVASTMSVSKSPGRKNMDLLSLQPREASKMLYSHSNKPCFGGVPSDNLMSWSSSLIFVIQYAIWRSHKRGRSPADVRICVVDTSKFPPGQFARDMWLLRAYCNTARLSDHQDQFFRFRLENSDYDNGEYFSQGIVNHGGRSCTFSLHSLIRSGLYSLYPEFADVQARNQWTNRVRQLRLGWLYEEQSTPRQDLECAFRMARECFRAFDVRDVALLLLSLKNRKLQARLLHDYPGEVDPSGPVEVCRYQRVARATRQGDHAWGARGLESFWRPLPSYGIESVADIFECT
ncbi:hypothetical protein EDB80DRAFT_822422 [Ilyonectria destructans]|nr:hypothetical protein EDB80DRAFT_822422 [Ilyonectria destructans]